MACASPAISVSLDRLSPTFGIGHNHFFLFVVVTSFIISILWTFFYLLQVRDFIKVKLPFTFLKVELIFTVVATILYVIAFIVVLAGFSWCSYSQKTNGSHLCDARVAGGVSLFSFNGLKPSNTESIESDVVNIWSRSHKIEYYSMYS